MENSVINFILLDDDIHDAVINDVEYQKISREEYEVYLKFRESLTEEQKTEFERFVELYTEEKCISNERYFKSGVKTGVRLVSECMLF